MLLRDFREERLPGRFANGRGKSRFEQSESILRPTVEGLRVLKDQIPGLRGIQYQQLVWLAAFREIHNQDGRFSSQTDIRKDMYHRALRKCGFT